MMDYYLLICTDPDKKADELLAKLKTSDKWTLTLDAGNIVPGSAPSFRVISDMNHEGVIAELARIFQVPPFFAVSFYTPGTQ